MKLDLQRPLVFFDLETTGLNIATDRIVELSYYKVFPDGSSEGKTFRINPEISIPASSSQIHGIYDEDVKDCPTFKQVAPLFVHALTGSDLAGYNSNHFDIPLLAEELIRSGMDFDLKRMKMVDVFTIFQKNEPRNLTAAYRFYCGKTLEDAHSANADTMATYEVLMSQLEKYELPRTVSELSAYTEGNVRFADFAGRIIYDINGNEVFNFGKYKGQPVSEVLKHDTGYYGWIMNGDFPQYTKNVVLKIYLSLRNK